MIDYDKLLSEKLTKIFRDPTVRARVENELNRYGQEDHEREPSRVKLAILKVAGTGMEKITEWTTAAKRDYRDLLASAEYPNQLTAPTWRLSASDRKAIEDKDAEQYRKWIEER